jgi:hypothetical protein
MQAMRRDKTRKTNGESTEAKHPQASLLTKEGDKFLPRIIGEQVWCPVCNDYAQFIKIANAAKLASVNRRTIYRYIEQGLVYTVKVAGKSYRVCSSCLLKFGDEHADTRKINSDKL